MSGPDLTGSGVTAPGLFSRVLAWPCIGMIWVYRCTLSPFVGRQCRFEPTCSRYALDAYRRYGGVRGTALTVRRLARCHPLNRGGYDPVPLGEDADARGETGDQTSDRATPEQPDPRARAG